MQLSVAKTLGVLSFTPLTMLQACAQVVDLKVGHHFGEGQEQPGDRKGCTELYTTGWIKGIVPQCRSVKEPLDLEASRKPRSTLFV